MRCSGSTRRALRVAGPAAFQITVTEQVPAAIWGERGLLNTRGELFVSEAHHIPAELPRLSGPEDSRRSCKALSRVREQLIPIGLDLRRVHVDLRGSWEMTLSNGIEVRLGRRDVPERTELFLDVVANIITGRAADIDYVDMRHGTVSRLAGTVARRHRSPIRNRKGANCSLPRNGVNVKTA